ncbi:MAG: hypothetical protein IJ399_05235 [Bacilli bacterium]|nr:hypothetical protein [Bacilli bacterium]
MRIEDTIPFFDFENYDYYYHMTGEGIGDLICEEGLLVDGTNIIGARNIKDTTTIEISRDMVEDPDAFEEFVSDEVNNSLLRDTSEMVIIGSPKELEKEIVHDYKKSKDEHFFQGIIHANMIMGYFNRDLEFVCNEKYAHGTDEFLDSFYDMGRYI